MKLYRLIWNRFVACQMMPALFDQTTIDVAAKGNNGADYLFRATGSVLKFEGFLKATRKARTRPTRKTRSCGTGCRRWPRESACASALSSPSSTSPSRPALTTKPPW